MLRNITRVLVEQKLDTIMKSSDYTGCTCDTCREDITACALNKLPPRYVSTDEGSLFARAKSLSAQYDFDILRAVALAIKIVGDAPHHNKA